MRPPSTASPASGRSSGAAAQAAGGGRRLDVQGLRAFAVAAVVVEHAGWPLHGGFVGVDVFFVISGFVIGRSLLREIAATGRLNLPQFYLRRVRRLLPAMSFVTAITAVFSALFVSPLGAQQKAALTGVAATVWSSNIALFVSAGDYFSQNARSNPYLHTWSLGVEEQFYLVFPILLGLTWRMKRAWWPACVMTALGLMSFTASAWMSYGGRVPGVTRPDLFAFYMMPTRFWEFAMGFLVAALPAKCLTRVPAAALGILGTLMLGSSAYSIRGDGPFPGFAALLPTVGTVLLIVAGATANGVSAAWSHPFLVHLGNISYSLYLWHWPAIVFAHRTGAPNWLGMPLAVVAALGLAELSYRHIEERFRGSRDSNVLVSLRPVIVGLLVAAATSTALGVGAVKSWGNAGLRETSRQLLDRPLGYRDCLSNTPPAQRDMSRCTWGAERHGKPVYLVGDSNAQQFTEALLAATERKDRPLVVVTAGGCPLVFVRMDYTGNLTQDRLCREFVRHTLSWLSTQESGDVYFAGANEQVINPEITLYRGGTPVSTPGEKAEVWGSATSRTILQLRSMGHRPVMIETTPHFPGKVRDWWNPADCANWTLIGRPQDCGVTISAADSEQRMAEIRRAEQIAEQQTGVPTVGTVRALCPSGWCSTFQDGKWAYRDGLHISPDESRRLAPLFVETLSLQ